MPVAIAGNFENIIDGHALGWACFPLREEKPIVYIADAKGSVIAQGVPTIKRPDIGGRVAGFRIALPPDARKQAGMKYYAIAGGKILPGGPLEMRPEDLAQWHLDGFSSQNTITGWLKSSGSCKVEGISLFIDGKEAGKAKNSNPIDEAGKTGRFNLAIPAEYFDGKVHDIRIIRAQPEMELGALRCYLPCRSEDEPTLADFPFLANEACELVPEARERKKMARERLAAQEQGINEIEGILAELENCVETNARYEKLCHAADRCAKSGDLEKAGQLFKEAIGLCPLEQKAHAGLLGVWYDCGREREALAYIEGLPVEIAAQAGIAGWKNRLHGLYQHNTTRILAFFNPALWPEESAPQYPGNTYVEWLQNLQSSGDLTAGRINSQFKLARQNGIDGFCYFYGPGQEKIARDFFSMLANGETENFPFCLCLAGGKGLDRAINEGIVSEIAPLLRRREYLRHDGKIILLVSQSRNLANPLALTKEWRACAASLGLGEIFLCVAENDSLANPLEAGFDAIFQFPDLAGYNRMRHAENINGVASAPAAYEALAEDYRGRPAAPWPVFHASFYKSLEAFPALANSPASDKMAAIHASWLWRNIGLSQRSGVSITFINSWNNWISESNLADEGAGPNPALAAIARVARAGGVAKFNTFWEGGGPLPPDARPIPGERILVVGRDACRSSRAEKLPSLAAWLQGRGYAVTIVLEEGGQDIAVYEAVAPVLIYDANAGAKKQWLDKLISQFGKLRYAFCLGVETAWASETLNCRKVRVTQIVGEFPAQKKAVYLDSFFWPMRWHARRIVFTSDYSARVFYCRYYPEKNRVCAIRESLRDFPAKPIDGNQKEEARRKLGMPDQGVVLAGYGDAPALDFFAAILLELSAMRRQADYYGLWLGNVGEEERERVEARLDACGMADKLQILPDCDYGHLAAADIFVSSGNGVWPPDSLKMAMAYGLPALAFDMGPDYAAIIGQDKLAAWPDYRAMAEKIGQMLASGEKLAQMGKGARQKALELFGPEAFFEGLLATFSTTNESWNLANEGGRTFRPKVSVIIPNYNYARYLELRLRTVMEQTYAPYEIIIIDDKSTDSSVQAIDSIIAGSSLNIIKIVNEANSGSPFASWKQGIARAAGDLIWIAEADDYCELTFLESLVGYFQDDSVMLAWADSQRVDSYGRQISTPYRTSVYNNRIAGVNYNNDFVVPGQMLLKKGLLHFNTIPNVSAVLMRRAAIPDLSGISDYISVGDWWLYARIVLKGRAAYHAETLNYHRRHNDSVVARLASGNINKALAETLRIFIDLHRLAPSVFTQEAVFELYRQQERLYAGTPGVNMPAAWLANNPNLSETCKSMRRRLNPMAFLEPDKIKERALLVVGEKYDTAHFDRFCRYLAHKHDLKIYLHSSVASPHPAYGHLMEDGLEVIADRQVPANVRTVYFLGLGAALLAAEEPYADSEKIIICDSSFDLLLKPENFDRKIYSRLGRILEIADDIFFLGPKMPGALNRLLSGSGKIASRLRYEPFVKLMERIIQPGPEQEKGVHAYGPCLPVLARQGLEKAKGAIYQNGVIFYDD